MHSGRAPRRISSGSREAGCAPASEPVEPSHHSRVSERPIKCALLTVPASLYDAELSLACPGLELVVLTPSAIGLTNRKTAVGKGRGAFDPLESVNPFDLREDDGADVVLIESHWYRLAAARHPDRIGEAIHNLERRADCLVGLDADQFALGFPPSALERLAVVIEFDGIYRDRALYSYVVGCRYPGGNWTEKLRPRPARYRARDLDKLRLSVPCFMRDLPVIRRAARARLGRAATASGKSMSRTERIGRDLGEALLVRAFGLASGRGRPLEVNCLVAPTHPQRIDAVRLLEGFSGKRGILMHKTEPELEAATDATETDAGVDDGDDDSPHYYMEWTEASSPQLTAAKLRQWHALLASAKPFAYEPMSRLRYLLELRRHQVAVAPTGYGELTYRHGEALMTGTALVCQDLSHVEMMFPFADRENVAFCRPDLSDLRSTVEELVRDKDLRQRIARQGRRTYTAWAARWREHLYDGIERHIRDVLS
jgi:Glycosyl transferases group 1